MTQFAEQYRSGLELKTKLDELRSARKRAKEEFELRKENLELQKQVSGHTMRLGEEELGLRKGAFDITKRQAARAARGEAREVEDWRHSFMVTSAEELKKRKLDPDYYAFVDPKTGLKKYRIKFDNVIAWKNAENKVGLEGIQRALLDLEYKEKKKLAAKIERLDVSRKVAMREAGVPEDYVEYMSTTYSLGGDVPDYVLQAAGIIPLSQREIDAAIKLYKEKITTYQAYSEGEWNSEVDSKLWKESVDQIIEGRESGKAGKFDRFVKPKSGAGGRTTDLDFHE